MARRVIIHNHFPDHFPARRAKDAGLSKEERRSMSNTPTTVEYKEGGSLRKKEFPTNGAYLRWLSTTEGRRAEPNIVDVYPT